MSGIKRFLEELSTKEGFKGKINKKVIQKAKKIFKSKTKK